MRNNNTNNNNNFNNNKNNTTNNKNNNNYNKNLIPIRQPIVRASIPGINSNAYYQYSRDLGSIPVLSNNNDNYLNLPLNSDPRYQQMPNNYNYGNYPQTNLLIQNNMSNYIIPNYRDNFQQEDSIVEIVKANESANKKNNYDLEKGLTLEIKALQKHFQFNNYKSQVLPIMVSVKTVDQTSDIDIQSNPLEGRPNIDLICVIDTSGSMKGEKMKNVKKTLIQLIDMLENNDRLSLITFNKMSVQLCNLKKVNLKNKNGLKDLVRSIQYYGETNIAAGIQTAFSILQNRKQQNPVSSIFLLSDGKDQMAERGIKNLFQGQFKDLVDNSFTIHSFGFGDDHDGPLMQKIAQMKDGSFYYVQQIEQVDEFFIDALGGLFSVVAQDINISIKINKSDEWVKKFFSNATVSKTYGNMWKVIKQNEGYSIKINQLFSGVSKDFIFEINIPQSNVNQIQDFERYVELVQATLTAIPVNNQYTTQILKDSSLVLTLFTQNEKIAQDSEISDNVEFNYLRVKAAQAMQDAIKYADSNQFNEGQALLTEMLKHIEKSHPKNREKLNVIKSDLLQCQKSAQPKVYEQQGKFNMLQNCNNNFNQQSYANRSTDIYQNSRQKVMVKQQQEYKQNNKNNNNY